MIEKLAHLIHERNSVSRGIAEIIDRPALNGHIGEYIASKIFNIKLEESAVSKGLDGYFIDGPLNGKSVNVKLYGKKENFLDISTSGLADYYLVLSGPDGDLASSRGKTRPLIISQVFLFNMRALMPLLVERGVKVGIATSVRKKDWENAMIFPNKISDELMISKEQAQMLQLFHIPPRSIIPGYSFQKTCNLEPVKDESGDVYVYKPHLRYDNRKGLKVHSYGYGPFCSFRIPSKYKGLTGVYAYQVNGKVMYIGKTEDLGERFNQGYGNISPRNCYEGGQQTNCRINNLVLEQTKKGCSVELHFFETTELDSVESSLIRSKKPQWNKSVPHPPTTPPTTSKPIKIRYSGKYKRIGEYLEVIDSNSVTLSYIELENILDFKLPGSAYNHNAWWSNGGHNHSYAWLDFGWRVDRVSLKNSIRFRKES